MVPGPQKVIKAVDDSNAVALASGSGGSPYALVVMPLGTKVDLTSTTLPLTNTRIDCPDSVYLMDVCVLGKNVFVCGAVHTASGDKAMFGRVPLTAAHDSFDSNLVIYLLDCGVKRADKISAYYVPGTTNIELAIVGVDYPDGTFWGTYSVINVDFTGPAMLSYTCNKVKLPTDYRITGLTQTANYVAVAGEFYDQHGFHFIAKYTKGAGSFNLDMRPISSSEYIIGNGVTCTSAGADKIAIAYYTQTGTSHFAMLKYFDLASLVSSIDEYRVPVRLKIQAPTLTYIPADNAVVMLVERDALSLFISTPAFVCVKPGVLSPTEVMYDNDGIDYYNVSTLGTRYFIAASPEGWLLRNETVMPPFLGCIRPSQISIEESEKVYLTRTSYPSNPCSAAPHISLSRRGCTIKHHCHKLL